jgi:predicted porin
MQKKIIALAVAALASTAAFAQTNVTIYGVADGSFDVINVDKSLNQGNNLGDYNRVSANSSYIGFKGVEDLGNGLKAVFQYEQGVSFDSGAGIGASRDSYVGLSSGFGTVVLGNLTGPTRALGASLDVNAGATGIGANSGIIGKIGGDLIGSSVNRIDAVTCTASGTCTSRFDTRWQNAVAYVSPTIAGFSGVAAYVADEDKTRDGVNGPGPTFRTTGYDVGAKWEGAGFMAGITYNWAQVGDIAKSAIDNVRLGGSYKASWGSIRAMWEDTSVDSNGTKVKQQKYGIGGPFNIGKAAIIGQYYQALESDRAMQTTVLTWLKLALCTTCRSVPA